MGIYYDGMNLSPREVDLYEHNKEEECPKYVQQLDRLCGAVASPNASGYIEEHIENHSFMESLSSHNFHH